MGFFKDLLGIKEPPKPKLGVSKKTEVNQALDILVGSDPVKITNPALVFKRMDAAEEEVGMVIAWCVGPIPDIRDTAKLYCNGKISTSSIFEYDPTSDNASWLAWSHFKGIAGQSAMGWQDFRTKFGWKNDCHGRGVAYSAIKYFRNGDVFETEPDFELVVAKKNLDHLDGTPAQDSKFSNNPVAWIRWYIVDATNGMGFDPSIIDSSLDECRDWIFNNQVSRVSGGSQYPRFTVNGLLRGSDNHEEKLDLLQQHCFGRVTYTGEKIGFVIKGRDSNPVLNLNKNNIVGKIKYTGVDSRERFNRVTCKFRNPEKNFEEDQVVYPPVGDPLYDTWLAEDDYQKREDEIDRPLCNNPYEALKFAEVHAKESREKSEAELTAGAEASQLVEWDVVSITDEKRGWDSELFLVEEIDEKDKDGVELYELTLSKYNPTIFEWAERGEYVYDAPYEPSDERLPAPANIQWDNNSHTLSWDAIPNVAEYNIIVNNDIIARPSTNSVYLPDLPAGSVEVTVIAYSVYKTSFPGRKTIGVNSPTTPTGIPLVNSKPGYITVTPPPPPKEGQKYNFRHWHSDDSQIVNTGAGLSITIPNVVANVTYTIEYQLVTQYGDGQWEQVEVNGVERISYTWVAYANDAQGNGISLNPAGKAYYGIATGRNTSESRIDNPDVYQWIERESGTQGAPAITAVLSNDNQTITTDRDGNNGNYSKAKSKISVLIGQVDDTSAWTISTSESSGLTGSLSGTTYTATNMTVDDAWVDFTCTRPGYTSLTKRFTLSKARSGEKGEQGEEGKTGPSPGDVVGIEGYTWGFKDGNSQGWTVAGGNATSVTKDSLRINATSTNPRILRSFPVIDGSVHYGIRIKIRCVSADVTGTATVYWETGAHTFTSSYRKDIEVSYKKGEWQYIVCDMRDTTAGGDDWVTHNIKGVRFDPASVDENFDIDGIIIGFFGSADKTNYDDNRITNKIATPIFVHDTRANPQSWPTGVSISGASTHSFISQSKGDCWIHVLAKDAEGVHIGFNGEYLGNLAGDNNETKWYSIHYADLKTGSNTVSIWSGSSDAGKYLAIIVTAGGQGDPSALINAQDSYIDNRATGRIDNLVPSGFVLNSDGTASYKDSAGNWVNVGAASLRGMGFSGAFNANYTSSSDIVSAALTSALLRNPSGEGLNFFNAKYKNPMPGIPIQDYNGATSSSFYWEGHNPPSNGRMIRVDAGQSNSYCYLGNASDDYNVTILPNRKWIFSTWIKARIGGNFNAYLGFTFEGNNGERQYYNSSIFIGDQGSKDYYSVVLDMTQPNYNQVTKVIVRLSIYQKDASLLFDNMMIEPVRENDSNGTKPSSYVNPVELSPIFNTNIIPATVAIGARSAQSAPAFGSYDDTSYSNRARINVSAHTLYTGDGGINYGSGDIRNLPQNTKHYVYVDDPYYQGNNDYKATTNITSITGSNTRRYMGAIKTYSTSSGGGYTDPDDRWCPHINTWLTDKLQVKDAKVGDIIDVVDNGKPGKAAIQALAFSEAECVRLVSESGAAKVVSLDTPIDRADGTSFLAANAMLGEGEQLLVNTHGQARWEIITSAEYVGSQPVAKLSVGGISFFGGENPESRICTHNMEKP